MEHDDDEMTAAYYMHPATQRMRKTYEVRRNGAMQELFNECDNSTDPRVRGAFQRYLVIDQAVHDLGGK